MKQKHIIMTIAAAVLFAAGCNDKESVWSSAVDDMDVRLTNLEKLCAEANTNITALQTIVNAQADGDVIKTVTEIRSEGKVVGYTVTFGKNDPITIYNGKDGNDGEAPVIGVKKHTDNVYYWTLNGEWLLDNGEMLRVTGNSGADGVSPQLKIENGYWMISYDSGSTWTQLGKATGEDGQDGDSMFLSVTQDENNVYFTLIDGTVIIVAKKVYENDGYYNGYAYVDLGLPSGLMWATCNVGAENPWDYGDYFAWGETTTKTTYDWSTYLDGGIAGASDCGTDKDLLKDMTDISGTQYDAARANMSGSWRMPTTEEQNELVNNCYWEWTDSYNGKGMAGYIVYKVKDASDKGIVKYSGGSNVTLASYLLSDTHVFLPAAGSKSMLDLYYVGEHGCYWSSSLYKSNLYSAHFLGFSLDGVGWSSGTSRYYGRSVRGVCGGNGGKIVDGYAYVDLGLPSGLKWATCNVGAENPWDYGDYFAWGETTTKTTYDWSTYLDGGIANASDCGTDKDLLKDMTDISGTQYDAARANMSGSWRMPTTEEQNELVNNCYWEWTDSYNGKGMAGYIVYKAKDANDNGKIKYNGASVIIFANYSLIDAHIFVPASGCRYQSDLRNASSNGYYWSSSLDENTSRIAYNLYFHSDFVSQDDYGRYLGKTVRGVHE